MSPLAHYSITTKDPSWVDKAALIILPAKVSGFIEDILRHKSSKTQSLTVKFSNHETLVIEIDRDGEATGSLMSTQSLAIIVALRAKLQDIVIVTDSEEEVHSNDMLIRSIYHDLPHLIDLFESLGFSRHFNHSKIRQFNHTKEGLGFF